jgi:hypothetical protein
MIYLFTPAFCKHSLLFDCLHHIYEDENLLPEEMTHVIIDNHYPIDKKTNQRMIQYAAEASRCVYIDCGKDRGLHGGLNFACEKLGVGSEDIVIGCDPDDRPDTRIFQAMVDVMKTDPTLAVLSGMFWVIEERLKTVPFKKEVIVSHNVLIHPNVEMWNVAAFNMRFIKEIGGFREAYNYYGGLESALFGEWQKRDLRLGYLADYKTESKPMDRQDPVFFDPEYRQWKTAHVGGFTGSFEEWLVLNGPPNHSEGHGVNL